jgi:putative DNA methylase
MTLIKAPKKLIEVALPLDDINVASAREKSIRNGHPSTLHLWWARRPLAAARAIIFAQMVNDPGYERKLGRGINKEKAKVERERLFEIIRKLVLWENVNNKKVLFEASQEIWRSWRETCELNRTHPDAERLFNPARLPAFHDPFAGGGALPLEGQRLGLESHASDLNPIPVLINKAMIEIPPKFRGHEPIGPILLTEKQSSFGNDWDGTKGLQEDVRRYGAWIRDEAFKRIGTLYPKVELPKANGGEHANVIAWIWARTVKSPSPAYSSIDVPLVRSFWLSTKKGKEAWVDAVVRPDKSGYDFFVRNEGKPIISETVSRAGGICLLSGAPIDFKYIRTEGKAGRMGQRLMAIVADGSKGKVYVQPTAAVEEIAVKTKASWRPEVEFFQSALGFRVGNYGLTKWSDLYTERQLVSLSTFSDLIIECRTKIEHDAVANGWADDRIRLDDGGCSARAYAEAISVYLAFAVDRFADYWSTLNGWQPLNQQLSHTFARQALSMVWDFAEANPFSGKGGSFDNLFEWTIQSISNLGHWGAGYASQADAATQTISTDKVVSTDPPYYDNIGYADLSDYFYVWLRRSLSDVFPSIFSTVVVPKAEELVATPARHGGKTEAEEFFMLGMEKAMRRLASNAHPAYPVTIYYAFKQAETKDIGTTSVGWETFLEAVIRSGLTISGTWPLSTEMTHRMRGIDSNALASSVVLVCQRREANAPTTSRREFLRELKDELADAVDAMIGGAERVSPISPVDLAQAVIGPGMAIFSKYSAVLEADGKPMTVHSALLVINRMLTEGADDFDVDTQFCLGWFDEQGWAEGDFGKATVLARAKGTSVDGVKDAGVVQAGGGLVRLLKPSEYRAGWTPAEDNRTPVWEALHQMIMTLRSSSEAEAGALLAGMPQRADLIRNLAYRLYTLCERKGWAEDARAYNELIASWSGIEAAAGEKGHYGSQMSIDV